MFAPKVARPQAKGATPSAAGPGHAHPMPRMRQRGGIEQIPLAQDTIGRQTPRPFPAQGAANPDESGPGGEQSRAIAPVAAWARLGSHGVMHDFSSIPLFPADAASQCHAGSQFDKALRSGFLQRKHSVGAVDDPPEREADRVADQVMRMPAATTQPSLAYDGSCPGCASGAASHQQEGPVPAVARSDVTPGGSGRPLDAADRDFFEPRFGWDFSAVRIHDDAEADSAARAVSARAFTLGRDIVFGSGHYEPGTGRGRHLLAHELAHVVQQRGSPTAGVLRRDPAPDTPPLRAGDDIAVAVYALPTDASPDRTYSHTHHVTPQGAIVIADGVNTVPITVAGLSATEAAQRIADGLVQAELFRRPRVCVTGPGLAAPACASARAAIPATAPPESGTQSPRQPERPTDPAAERTEEWIRFMKMRIAMDATLPPEDRARAMETMRRFQEWYEKHHSDPNFVKADPAKIYADISVAVLKRDVEESSRKKIEAEKEAAAESPEVLKARSAKFDEFLAKAMKLWGYSSRTFPYTIPLDSEGKDILVTGDPALQRVLNDLANDLVHWASIHLGDSNYATVSVNQVLLNLLQGGYAERIGEAQKQPLEHETIDRNEILAKSALASFGETVATGLFAVAVVGLFVGAEVITAGQATWLLVGVAGYSGVRSYQARREEIEHSNYDVPVPVTMLHAAGDIIGVSQLIEGITGQRLGTDAPLGSEARSSQVGVAAGTATTMLLGSRAYRAGQRVGQTARLSMPGVTPAGPNANIPLPPAPARPAVPQPNPAMGAVESGARTALPENLRPGLDLWSAEIRQNGGNPETVFRRLPAERIRAQAETFLKRYEAAVSAADRGAAQAARATDDPLHPRLRNVRGVPGSKVTLHYENMPPSEHEIAQAVEIAKRTGEAVHLFGDTASGINYPGIDGTIGEPARPLSLKRAVSQAHPNLARQMAADALDAAQRAGYSHVEVRIDMPGSTVAQIQAAWDGPPPRATDPIPGPAFEGDVIARIIIRGSDGEWTLRPPLAGPARTGVSPVPPLPDRPDQKEKR